MLLVFPIRSVLKDSNEVEILAIMEPLGIYSLFSQHAGRGEQFVKCCFLGFMFGGGPIEISF